MTAPEPTACPECSGAGEQLEYGWQWVACPACTCSICGETTDTPPVCRDCDCREEARAKRRADV